MCQKHENERHLITEDSIEELFHQHHKQLDPRCSRCWSNALAALVKPLAK